MTWPQWNQQHNVGLQRIFDSMFNIKHSVGVVSWQSEKAASQHGKISYQQLQCQATELHHVVGVKQTRCSGTAATWDLCYSPNVGRSVVQDMMFACKCTQDQ